MTEFEYQAQKDCDKLDKVLESCKTEEQLQNAYRYFQLWYKKYEECIKAPVLSFFGHRHMNSVMIYNNVLKRVKYG